eukprot:GHVS01029396.1.p1 GENE.GHVS01029396.1~~GHVS01029396.1.p1  ORF type:complete len:959 (-),score=170.60 GHVS01029396.1:605-3208(-)
MADFCGSSAADKRSCLHEGASKAVKSASVELVFDNTERSFGLFKHDEVSVKRSVADGKDEWFIDGKKMLKSVFIEHMESVGFSLNNPYYMVRQGKVAELSQMSDRKRFELLSDIAGVRLYETRRSASMKHLVEKDEELASADETLATIKAKTERLEIEQAELREYQEIDSKRRCVEYYLSSIAWRTATAAELKATKLKSNCVKAIGHYNVQLNDIATAADEDAEKKRALEEQTEVLESDHSVLLTQQCEAQRELSEYVSEEHELKEAAEAEAEHKLTMTARLDQLRNEMANTESELVGRRAERDKLETVHLDAVQAHKLAEAECGHLLAKRSRSCSYISRSKRDEALSVELEHVDRLREQYTRRQQTAGQQIERIDEATVELLRAKEAVETRMHEMPAKLEEAAQQSKSIAEALDKLLQTRRRLQQKHSELQREERTAEKLKVNEEDRFYKSMRGPVRQAIEEADNWKARARIADSEAPGMLIKNITVAPAFQVAVETVGRNQLLNYLVADQPTLSRLARHIKDRSAGQLTITPLRELPTTYNSSPDRRLAEHTDGVKALIDCIECHSVQVGAAVKQIFGKVLLCDSLATADQLHSAGWAFEFVTPGGDTLAKRGTVAGGFVKERNLRFRILDEIRKCEFTLCRVREEMKTVADQLIEADHGHRQQLQSEALSRQQFQTLTQQQTALQTQLHEFERTTAKHQQDKASFMSQRESDERDVELWKTKIEDLKKEMAGPLGNLSVDEEQRLSCLHSQLKTLDETAEKAGGEFQKVRDEVFKSEAKLRDSLTFEAQQIEMTFLTATEANDEADRLSQLSDQIGGLKTKINEIKESVEFVASKLSQKTLTRRRWGSGRQIEKRRNAKLNITY